MRSKIDKGKYSNCGSITHSNGVGVKRQCSFLPNKWRFFKRIETIHWFITLQDRSIISLWLRKKKYNGFYKCGCKCRRKLKQEVAIVRQSFNKWVTQLIIVFVWTMNWPTNKALHSFSVLDRLPSQLHCTKRLPFSKRITHSKEKGNQSSHCAIHLTSVSLACHMITTPTTTFSVLVCINSYNNIRLERFYSF